MLHLLTETQAQGLVLLASVGGILPMGITAEVTAWLTKDHQKGMTWGLYAYGATILAAAAVGLVLS